MGYPAPMSSISQIGGYGLLWAILTSTSAVRSRPPVTRRKNYMSGRHIRLFELI
jgi:hypothetical protein